ncbi:MAG: hypothetical protein R3345_09735 [Fulvivirga sp.]|nr:hypothetical protein [Fulvivirga sp.]
MLAACNDQGKNNLDSANHETNPEEENSAILASTDTTADTASNISNSTPPLNQSNLNVDTLIKQYPAGQKAELKNFIKWKADEWENVPNPISATYQGNDFGDYHHIIFKSKNGVEYDFGRAQNDYGEYNLHTFSGQYEDNPEFVGKQFKVYWEWKLSKFYCCDGEHGEAKAYLPTITKLKLIEDKAH